MSNVQLAFVVSAILPCNVMKGIRTCLIQASFLAVRLSLPAVPLTSVLL